MLNQTLFAIVIVALLSSCASTPKSSQEKISKQEAEAFLKKYCSKIVPKKALEQEMTGDILVRSSTKEFKGQYPASIHYSKDQDFSLEITNLLGGTVAILKGGPTEMEVFSPSHPKYNRKGIKQYMGLSIPLLSKLIHGDLPCPDSTSVKVEGTEILVPDSGMEWRIERSDTASGSVPVRMRIFEEAKVKVELVIEDWDVEENYAKKVKVSTSEGDLKWNWRSRKLK